MRLTLNKQGFNVSPIKVAKSIQYSQVLISGATNWWSSWFDFTEASTRATRFLRNQRFIVAAAKEKTWSKENETASARFLFPIFFHCGATRRRWAGLIDKRRKNALFRRMARAARYQLNLLELRDEVHLAGPLNGVGEISLNHWNATRTQT